MEKSYLGSIKTTVTIPDLALKNREMLRDFKRHMREAHIQGLKDGRNILRRVLYDKKIFDTGKLINSVAQKLFLKTDEIFSGTVHFNQPGREYAYFIEHGRGPGDPPPAGKLTNWAHRHGIKNKAAIWIIRARIAERGTRARPFMEEAEREIQSNYQALVTKAVDSYRKRIN